MHLTSRVTQPSLPTEQSPNEYAEHNTKANHDSFRPCALLISPNSTSAFSDKLPNFSDKWVITYPPMILLAGKKKKKKSLLQDPSLWGIATTTIKQLLPTGHCSQRARDQRTNPHASLSQATASADHHLETPISNRGTGLAPQNPHVSFFHAEKSLATALSGRQSQICRRAGPSTAAPLLHTKDSQRVAEVSSYPNVITNIYLIQQKTPWFLHIFPEHLKEQSPKYHLSFETLSLPR